MRNPVNTTRLLALVISALVVASPGLAKDQGGGNEHGRGNSKHEQKQADKAARKEAQQARKHGAPREEVRAGAYFNDQHRAAARQYYAQAYGNAKRCPPGLAKKNNGCMPPGQARKLTIGQPVPAGVTLYAVPQPVIVHLPPPPYGYRYARVGNDIVLVQNRNQLIVDIIVGLLG